MFERTVACSLRARTPACHERVRLEGARLALIRLSCRQCVQYDSVCHNSATCKPIGCEASTIGTSAFLLSFAKHFRLIGKDGQKNLTSLRHKKSFCSSKYLSCWEGSMLIDICANRDRPSASRSGSWWQLPLRFAA
eukprot:5642139-Amphidinium_carterae.2